jgi:hypothetical protein
MTNLPKSKRQPSSSPSYDLHGLALPATALKALQKRGIYCVPGVSVEHQHLAKRYVLRGVESGGAVVDMGRACAFFTPQGKPLPCLQSINSIAVNGRHAIVLAESLVRIEMLRIIRTCELAITLHTLSVPSGRTRPEVSSKILFRGSDGALPVDLWQEEHKPLRGQLTPIFYSRAGEVVGLPERFEEAIKKMTAAVCCIGCRHTHVAIPPGTSGVRV